MLPTRSLSKSVLGSVIYSQLPLMTIPLLARAHTHAKFGQCVTPGNSDHLSIDHTCCDADLLVHPRRVP